MVRLPVVAVVRMVAGLLATMKRTTVAANASLALATWDRCRSGIDSWNCRCSKTDFNCSARICGARSNGPVESNFEWLL